MRPAVGIAPPLTDAELVTLAMMQAMLGFISEARWLRHARPTCGISSRIAFLVSLAFAIAASAILPALLFNLWWKGFTTKGAIWSMYGGLLIAVLLTTLSPAVSGNPTALLPGADFAVFPLRNPGLIFIPVGFLLAWAASLLDRRQRGGADYTETEIRVLTGVGTGPRGG